VKEKQAKKGLSYFILYPMLLVFTIWLVFWIEETFHYNFAKYGVYPWRVSGLKGIIFSPLIHANISHILHNTLPLFIASSFLFYHYRSVAWRVLIIGWILTGIGTWLLGRPSYHIGMSGVNNMLISFLFFSGIIINYHRLVAVSLIMVFLYGSLIWLMFPIVDYVSWEGHVSGFASGLLLAFIYGTKLKKIYPNKNNVIIYPEDSDFLRQFDENGNFIEYIEKNEEEEKSFDS